MRDSNWSGDHQFADCDFCGERYWNEDIAKHLDELDYPNYTFLYCKENTECRDEALALADKLLKEKRIKL